LSQIQVVFVDLGDKDSSDRFVERRAIHVDGGPDGEDEACHASVDAVVFQETLQGDGQGGWAAEQAVISNSLCRLRWALSIGINMMVEKYESSWR